MNEDIMVLSNKLIYSDRLRCGSEGVAKRGLVLPRPSMLKTLHPPSGPSSCPGNTCWIEKLLDERYLIIHNDKFGPAVYMTSTQLQGSFR